MIVRNPQYNTPVERVRQVILKMLVTKYLDNKVFDHIYTWGENLTYIVLVIRASYHHTIMETPNQVVFGRDMILNLASVVYWRVVTTAKKRQVDIDIFQEKYRRVVNGYIIGNKVYGEMTVIYRKLDYKKKGLYRITEAFTNGTVGFQQGQLNKHINIRRLSNHFYE